MAKQVVEVDGENVLMTENDAKMTRGVRWALVSIALFILVVGALFLLNVFRLAADRTDPNIGNTPSTASPASR